MNTLDPYTREKANQIHLDEMHREARVRRLLRGDGQPGDSRKQRGSVRRYVSLATAILIALLAAYLTIAAMGLHLPR